MTDAPRISSADELNKVVRHTPLFEAVKSARLKSLLEEALQRMSGFGEDAESQYQRALAALRDAGSEALNALAHEFERLASDQYVNRWAVVQLLTDLEDPRTLDALNRIIASPLPKERSDDPHGSPAARELVVRTTAVEAVARLAAGGSDEARAALLKYVRHSVRSVKIAAALAYVEQGGGKPSPERASEADAEIRLLDPGYPPGAPSRNPAYRGPPFPAAKVTAGGGDRASASRRRASGDGDEVGDRNGGSPERETTSTRHDAGKALRA